MATLDTDKIEIIAADLEYPEGPIHCADGGIVLVEIKGKRLTYVAPDGHKKTLATLKGGGNGAAVGQDGNLYICNDGGFDWIGIPPADPKLWVTGNQPQNYTGGSLDCFNSATGVVQKVVTHVADREFPPGNPVPPWDEPYALSGLDDLVVDVEGGIWFTDYGKNREREQDITGVYYRCGDGHTVTQKIYPLSNPNGIALSPDGSRLYVALTFQRKVVYYELSAPGIIKPNPNSIDGAHLLCADFIGQSVLDSMAVDSKGNVYVATMLPEGNNPMSNGGISIVTPEGEASYYEIKLPNGAFAPLPSNICFGGDDMKTAFITCGGSGYLIKMPCDVAGLPLNHNGSAYQANVL